MGDLLPSCGENWYHCCTGKKEKLISNHILKKYNRIKHNFESRYHKTVQRPVTGDFK